MFELEIWLEKHGWKKQTGEEIIWRRNSAELIFPKSVKGKLIKYRDRNTPVLTFLVDDYVLSDSEMRITFSSNEITQTVVIRSEKTEV